MVGHLKTSKQVIGAMIGLYWAMLAPNSEHPTLKTPPSRSSSSLFAPNVYALPMVSRMKAGAWGIFYKVAYTRYTFLDSTIN